jgi:hypothetical protein
MQTAKYRTDSSGRSTVCELACVPNRCRQSRRGKRADATDLLQTYSYRVLPSDLFDFPVEFFDTLVEDSQISPQST